MFAITNLSTDAIFTFAALISCATAISSTSPSSSTTQSTAGSSPTVITDTTKPVFIELVGFNSGDPYAIGVNWGTAFEDQTAPYETWLRPFSIGDSISTIKNFTTCSEFTNEIQHVSTNSPNSPTLLASYDEIFIGWPLVQQINDSSNASCELIETVPFAFNVGDYEKYNGSLVIGGWYDANRIASTQWHLVPESVGNDSFLITGQLDITIMIDSKPHDARLCYNCPDALTFPDTLPGACANESLTISFPGLTGREAFDLPFPPKYRNNATCGNTVDDMPIILGDSFFQAAYTYVDKTGKIYLTAANNLNATSINMEPFDEDATLTLPAGVTAATATPSPTKSMSTPSFSAGIGWKVLFVGILAWIIS